MRILVISNLYPPHHLGGYELGCRDIIEVLRGRGHEIKVLTSTYGVGKPESAQTVYRWLQAQFGWEKQNVARFAKRLQNEIYNQRAFNELCTTFTPDLIYAWNLAGISISLIFIAQRMGLPVSYYISDNWLTRWQLRLRDPIRGTGERIFGLCLRILHLQPPFGSLDLTHAQFASEYLRMTAAQAHLPVTKSKVVYWGIDINRFPNREVCSKPTRMLYVGQVVPHKGVHTAIEALKIIIQRYGYESATLSIVGGTVIPDYEAHLQQIVKDLDLENHVRFTGPMPRESLPSIYKEHDILIFPSVWDEPFSISLLEAMSSGLAVVSTSTGGSPEILRGDVNALIFSKENAESCATQIVRLMDDRRFFEEVCRNGRRTVEEGFRIQTMVDSLEKALYETIAS